MGSWLELRIELPNHLIVNIILFMKRWPLAKLGQVSVDNLLNHITGGRKVLSPLDPWDAAQGTSLWSFHVAVEKFIFIAKIWQSSIIYKWEHSPQLCARTKEIRGNGGSMPNWSMQVLVTPPSRPSWIPCECPVLIAGRHGVNGHFRNRLIGDTYHI